MLDRAVTVKKGVCRNCEKIRNYQRSLLQTKHEKSIKIVQQTAELPYRLLGKIIFHPSKIEFSAVKIPALIKYLKKYIR